MLAGLLAHDNFLPHVFGLRADRRVFRYGVGFLAVAAALLLLVTRGDTQALIPMFAVGVFIGFTLSQIGMVKHWHSERSRGSTSHAWLYRACVNGLGAVLTFAATIIELVSKFVAGAWLVALVIPLLVLLFMAVCRAYARIGVELAIGQVPPPPVKQASLVVVPVSFREEWQRWRPDVPLLTLRSVHRSLAKPIVSYLRSVEAEDKYHRLVVVIPEVEPTKPWQWLLHHQRGVILDRAIRRGTQNVVLCRLRYRLETLVAEAEVAEDHEE